MSINRISATISLLFIATSGIFAQDPLDSLFQDEGISTQKNKLSVEVQTLQNLPLSFCYEHFFNLYNRRSRLGIKTSLTPLIPGRAYKFKPFPLYHLDVEGYNAGPLPLSAQIELKYWSSKSYRPKGIFWGFNYRFSNFIQADFHDIGVFFGLGGIFNNVVSLSGKLNIDSRWMKYKDKTQALWPESGTSFAGLIYLTLELGYLF